MTVIKTKAFKHSLVGVTIHCTRRDINTGKVGHWIEDLIESFGIKINRYEGVDLIDYGVEVKSRCQTSTTFITVATMNRDYIINTPYKDSVACKKLQQVRIVDYVFDEVNGLATIVSDKVYDWSQPELQYVFEQKYERGRHDLAQGFKASGWWELKTDTKNSFIFKIYDTQWEKLKNCCDTKNTFYDIFQK